MTDLSKMLEHFDNYITSYERLIKRAGDKARDFEHRGMRELADSMLQKEADYEMAMLDIKELRLEFSRLYDGYHIEFKTEQGVKLTETVGELII